MVMEAYMDTPLVNGAAYPYLPVGRKAYRFRILNASNDRMMNLSLYYASPLTLAVTA
jgi:FtsP/CotA-like multicopper oxidase with cupredoxin domain